MLHQRLHQPLADTVLYHYCSADTLLAIIQSKSIRMSDANMMNDYAEGRYGYGVFEEAASEILKDEQTQKVFPDFNGEFFDKVDEVVSGLQLSLHPVIASFSKKPDVLSQWFRYADRGRGFALGLDANLLLDMPATLVEIEYDRAIQINEAREALAGIFMRNKTESLNYGRAFREDCAVFATMLLSFKSSGFREEEEVRLIHLLDVTNDDDRPRLKDEGGIVRKRKVKGQQVKYRVSDGAFIAYIDLPFPSRSEKSLAKQIWFGPKNENAFGNVLYFASENRWKVGAFHNSEVTFR